MLNLGALAFAAPWVLVALAGLPLLWWLLKVTPPAPRLLRFPAIRLLFGLRQDEQTPARTPLWLVILRMIAAALVILGLAHPLLNPGAQFPVSGPLLMVVDDGWAAARGWDARLTAMDTLIDRAERAERGVILLTTAPPADGAPIAATGLLTANDARNRSQALEPKPWPVDRDTALAALQGLQLEGQANVVWLTDGVADGTERAFAEALQPIGPVTVMRDAPGQAALALVPPRAGETALTATVLRTGEGTEETHWLRALDERGRLLAREQATLAAGEGSAEATLGLPAELRNRLARIEIEGVRSAGAVVLLDERWRRRPVGILTGSNDRSRSQPLLSEIYYLERALSPYAEVRKGTVQELLARGLAVLVVPDSTTLTATAQESITAWMAQGGTVLRFAGPRLGGKPDDLLPVPLRTGDRTLGGAMSWAQPAELAPFEEGSPFAGLEIPPDVQVARQVLAQPALDLPNKTWARLGDGTPLVTAASRERGRLVLFHTTASPEWSNLSLSGLFVGMLRRVVALSQGVTGARADALPPLTTLDGFGRLGDPPSVAQPLGTGGAAEDGAERPLRASPAHPPGFYGTDTSRFALNLAEGMTALTPIGTLPSGIAELQLASPEEFDFKPWLLAAALALLIADMWIGLVLRGLAPALGFRRKDREMSGQGSAAAVALVLAAGLAASLAASSAALAQDRTAASDAERAMAATFETRLAYVETGDSQTDRVSRAGLAGLSLVLRTRTSVEPKEPMAVNIERDELSFFPFIYWPITAGQQQPSASAQDKLATYLQNGGMILFDTRDQALGGMGQQGGIAAGGPGAAKLRQIVSGLQLPALMPVPKGHILSRAFYLLTDYPGRWTGGTLWVESAAVNANDGVSSVVIGANDYAAAWAMDRTNQPLFPVVPGGSQQREMAYRFGVNIVMYALTGNYKADQVHVPAILERLGQ